VHQRSGALLLRQLTNDPASLDKLLNDPYSFNYSSHQADGAVAHGDKAQAAAVCDLIKLQRQRQRQLRAPRQRRAPLRVTGFDISVAPHCMRQAYVTPSGTSTKHTGSDPPCSLSLIEAQLQRHVLRSALASHPLRLGKRYTIEIKKIYY